MQHNKEDYGKNLLIDLKTIKSFDTKNYKNLIEENKILQRKLKSIEDLEERDLTESKSIDYVLITKQVSRNKRILDAYVYHRRMKIIENVFDSKRHELAGFLNEDEEMFEKKFLKLISKVKKDYDFDLNLFSQEAPNELFVQIFCKEDCGIVINEGEIIELKANSVFFLKKESIRHLINTDKIKII